MSNKPNREGFLTKEERNFFQQQIKEQLAEFRLTQVWLIRQLSDRGLETDKAEMSSMLSGTRKGAKVDEILKTSAEILAVYAKCMVGEAT